MTHEGTLRMAREAGFSEDTGVFFIDESEGICTDELLKFAALVAAAEREECAKVCEEFDFEFQDDSSGSIQGAADAIRARGNT